MRSIRRKDCAIETDEITVWVNKPDGMIGRFGVAGIDIHRPVGEQSDKGECLYCTHSMAVAADWPIFRAKMMEHHGIDVPDDFRPKRLAPALPTLSLKPVTADEAKKLTRTTRDGDVEFLAEYAFAGRTEWYVVWWMPTGFVYGYEEECVLEESQIVGLYVLPAKGKITQEDDDNRCRSKSNP